MKIDMPSKKDKERGYLEALRKLHRLPSGRFAGDDQERPDFVVKGVRKVGIEMTHLYSEQGSSCVSEQRQAPLRRAVVAEARELYRAGGGTDIELTLGFRNDRPIAEGRRKQLPSELAEFAHRIKSDVGVEIQRELNGAPQEISFAWNAGRRPCTRWLVNQVNTAGLMSNERLEAEVKRKEVKAAGYEACDAYWLIVVVEAMDPAQEAEIRVDESVTASNVFEKVIVFHTFGIVRYSSWPWHRRFPSSLRAVLRHLQACS